MSRDSCDDPIFIIGTERSGSNVLRLILDAHSEIAIPHPPHILKYFADLEPYYDDLRVDRNFRKLIRDVLALVRGHIHPWPHLPAPEFLLARAERNLFGLTAAIYEHHLAGVGKRRWGCKSTFMIHHVDRVRARYPRACFIWLVRDPRDVALSSRDSVFNPYHPYFVASLWRDQQQIGVDLSQAGNARLLRLHYEHLVRNPKSAVHELCSFLELQFEPQMLNYFTSDAARVASSLARDWANLASPLQPDKAQRFARELDPKDLRVVETIAGPVMKQLDYTLMHPPQSPNSISMARKLHYWLANEARRIVVEYRSLRLNRNHARRWARALRMQALRARLKLTRRALGKPADPSTLHSSAPQNSRSTS